MRTAQSILAVMCALTLAAPPGLSQQGAPKVARSDDGQSFAFDPAVHRPNVGRRDAPNKSGFNWFTYPYRDRAMEPINLSNSGRAEALIRDGKLYLSLKDAIALALENNLDIEIQRYGPRLADADLLRAEAGGVIRGVQTQVTQGAQSAVNFVTGGFGGGTGGSGAAFGGAAAQGGAQSGTLFQVTGTAIPNLDPIVNFNLSRSKTSNPQTNSFVTGTTALIVENTSFNMGVQKQFLTGTGLNFNWNQNNILTNSPNNDLNPFYRGNFQLQLTQRILQGFSSAVNNRNIRISKNNLKVSDLAFKLQVIEITRSVVNLYLDLVSFNETVKVRQKAVELAQKLYEDNKKQVEIGTLAPIEVVRAEAQLAQATTDLIVAETQVLQQETIIKNALSRTGVDSPTLQAARIVPTDTLPIPGDEPLPSYEELLARALEKRPEVEQTRIQINNTKIGLAGAKNQLLPSLDVFASMTNNGLAGAINTLPPPGGIPINPRNPDPFFIGGVGLFYEQLFRRNFPDYAVGFQLNVPIRNRAAQADITNDMLRLRQQELQEQRLKNSIKVEVQQAIISLEQARAGYQAALKARQLQEQTLDAEQKKFALGSSTIFVVVQTQRDLTQAQANEVTAITSYNQARNRLNVAIGEILEVNGVDMVEAIQGEVKRVSSVMQ
jgi:outer membrane protein